MAQEPVTEPEPVWISAAEAAARLGISEQTFRRHAKAGGVDIRIRNTSRGRLPGVDWASVEAWIARSRIEPRGPFNRKWSVGWRQTLANRNPAN